MFVWSKLSALKWLDAWEERFIGHSNLVISRLANQDSIRVEVYCEKKSVAEKIKKEFGGSIRELKNQNWAALAPELPPPVKVRNSMLIVAEQKKAELAEIQAANPGKHIISIPPELAFGTGHHETTSTVLRLLVDYAKSRKDSDWNVLDLGTGSAVLAIAAEKLGAHEVWGCDNDAMAVKVALQNAKRNKTKKVTLECADVFKWKPTRKWDVVAANLFSTILEQIFPKIVKSMKKNGVVFISGILKQQAESCLAAGEKAGLTFDKVITKGKWVTAQGRLK